MRILFDARSVRTPAGLYVLRGLSTGWLSDSRVSAVLVAVPPKWSDNALADGVELVRTSGHGWLRHLSSDLPRIASRAGANVIFVPNGLPPRDERAVIYFQDLYHFQPFAQGMSVRRMMSELARTGWRSFGAPAARLAIAVSTDIYRHVVRRLHVPTTIIPNGVDVGPERWRRSGDRVVVMGGHGERKGEETALFAWAQLASSLRRHLRLELIGVQPDRRRLNLERLAKNIGMDASVTITGALPREEFLARVAASVLAISCSRLEAFGLPVAEALAMGAPVLASDIPSHRELIARAGAGVAVPAGDATALARRISSALNGSPPPRLTSPPLGWSWRDRAREHVDAYLATP